MEDNLYRLLHTGHGFTIMMEPDKKENISEELRRLYINKLLYEKHCDIVVLFSLIVTVAPEMKFFKCEQVGCLQYLPCSDAAES